jgi:hypothetical protein
VTAFYRAFLGWRESLGFDNAIAWRLPALLIDVGLTEVEASDEDEVVGRGEPGFAAAVSVWQTVIDDLGPHIVSAGLLTRDAVAVASTSYAAWVQADASSQRMVLRSATGRRPD